MMGALLAIACAFIVAFLLGSIPWGVLISTRVYKIDLRAEGSGNIGSTNAFRILGAKGGIACFVLDCAKGLAASGFSVLLAADLASGGVAYGLLGGASAFADFVPDRSLLVTVSLLAAVWGHIFNPWLHFKGGKGVATAFGCLIIAYGWPWALLELAVFFAVAVPSKYVSAGSLAAAAACAAVGGYLYWTRPLCAFLCILTGLTVIWAHRSNIARLARGEESKFSVKKKPAD